MSAAPPSPASANPIEQLGAAVASRIEGFGVFAAFVGSTVRWLPVGFTPGRLGLTLQQLYTVGVGSMSVVMLVGAFVGAVIGIETYNQLAAIGQETRLGGLIALSVVKQIGPVLAAVMIAGRVGGSVSAELGTMNVSEQIDALRAMGADPVGYLVVPRVVACVVMLPVLTVFSDLMGVYGGYIVVVLGFGVDAADYWGFSEFLVTSWDVLTGLIKALVFGLLIGLIACFKGFHCGGGASGVGRATTEAFVMCFIAIIIANFFLAKFLNEIGSLLYGGGGGIG